MAYTYDHQNPNDRRNKPSPNVIPGGQTEEQWAAEKEEERRQERINDASQSNNDSYSSYKEIARRRKERENAQPQPTPQPQQEKDDWDNIIDTTPEPAPVEDRTQEPAATPAAQTPEPVAEETTPQGNYYEPTGGMVLPPGYGQPAADVTVPGTAAYEEQPAEQPETNYYQPRDMPYGDPRRKNNGATTTAPKAQDEQNRTAGAGYLDSLVENEEPVDTEWTPQNADNGSALAGTNFVGNGYVPTNLLRSADFNTVTPYNPNRTLYTSTGQLRDVGLGPNGIYDRPVGTPVPGANTGTELLNDPNTWLQYGDQTRPGTNRPADRDMPTTGQGPSVQDAFDYLGIRPWEEIPSSDIEYALDLIRDGQVPANPEPDFWDSLVGNITDSLDAWGDEANLSDEQKAVIEAAKRTAGGRDANANGEAVYPQDTELTEAIQNGLDNKVVPNVVSDWKNWKADIGNYGEWQDAYDQFVDDYYKINKVDPGSLTPSQRENVEAAAKAFADANASPKYTTPRAEQKRLEALRNIKNGNVEGLEEANAEEQRRQDALERADRMQQAGTRVGSTGTRFGGASGLGFGNGSTTTPYTPETAEEKRKRLDSMSEGLAEGVGEGTTSTTGERPGVSGGIEDIIDNNRKPGKDIEDVIDYETTGEPRRSGEYRAEEQAPKAPRTTTGGSYGGGDVPDGSEFYRPSYGQDSDVVVKAPYKTGGYTEAELQGMGNAPYTDPYGYQAYEGYYQAPDKHWYPVDQQKADYWRENGGSYRGWNDDMRSFYNTYGTFRGYRPDWRTAGRNTGGNRNSGGGGSGGYYGGHNYSNGYYNNGRYYTDASNTLQPDEREQLMMRVYNMGRNWAAS